MREIESFMHSRNGHNRKRGQTLIIAIMVMFVLAVIATIFIAIVARNLFQATRYSSVDAVQQIAEAGIRYADQMLTTSEAGADWRPAPDNIGVTDPGNWVPGVEPTADTGNDYEPGGREDWQYLRDEHPDFKWIRAYWPSEYFPPGYTPGEGEMGCAGPTGGYTTYKTGGGRYLLRVSYNPNPKDPLSKFIKIESIGRWDTIELSDPTTLRLAGNSKLRREVTAFKPIGITDYLRFVTNKANRSADMPLGIPGYHLNFGRPANTKFGENGVRGGPIRVNGNLLWYGNYSNMGSDPGVEIFLRGGVDQADNKFSIDRVEISGEINSDFLPGSHMPPDLAVRVQLHAIFPTGTIDSYARSSSDSDFSTFYGFYRDGSDQPDPDHFARGVKRIEPPLVDQPDPTDTTTRYRLLTLNSGERIETKDEQGNYNWVNLGAFGWGRGVYINNSRDRQSESETLVGGYTVRADWLKPNNSMSTYWDGPYYVPPGAIITLRPDDFETINPGPNQYKQYYFTITRTDSAGSSGQKAVWYDAWGNPRPDWGRTVRMPYPDPVRGRDVHTDFNGDKKTKHIDGNGVIYAEGNIRIRGMLPPGMQLTVASNQNIYIEGSLLKYRDPEKPVDDTDPYRGADNSCGLALLARENICVNTTQFFSPLNSISADDVASDAGNDQPPFHVIVKDSPESILRCGFEFGPWESESWWNNNSAPPNEWRLMLRHAGQYGPTYINAWLNPRSDLPNGGLLWLNNSAFTGLPRHVWGVGDPNFGSAGAGFGSSFVGQVFDLDSINATLYTSSGLENILQIGLDQTTYTRNNYLVGGLAVVPMDVRIEAVLYAQEGSFFVIPGNWFNPNPADTLRNRPPGTNDKFPYFGQPLDIRIIVDGAVSENIPAAVSDVGEWMAKWGRIPEVYGSSSFTTAHPGEGLTLLYDDHVGWPLTDLTNPATPIRYDKYGRALPIAPKLPVCTTLLYLGDVM